MQYAPLSCNIWTDPPGRDRTPRERRDRADRERDGASMALLPPPLSAHVGVRLALEWALRPRSRAAWCAVESLVLRRDATSRPWAASTRTNREGSATRGWPARCSAILTRESLPLAIARRSRRRARQSPARSSRTRHALQRCCVSRSRPRSVGRRSASAVLTEPSLVLAVVPLPGP